MATSTADEDADDDEVDVDEIHIKGVLYYLEAESGDILSAEPPHRTVGKRLPNGEYVLHPSSHPGLPLGGGDLGPAEVLDDEEEREVDAVEVSINGHDYYLDQETGDILSVEPPHEQCGIRLETGDYELFGKGVFPALPVVEAVEVSDEVGGKQLADEWFGSHGVESPTRTLTDFKAPNGVVYALDATTGNIFDRQEPHEHVGVLLPDGNVHWLPIEDGAEPLAAEGGAAITTDTGMDSRREVEYKEVRDANGKELLLNENTGLLSTHEDPNRIVGLMTDAGEVRLFPTGEDASDREHAAALKIQSVHRGNMARQEVKKVHISRPKQAPQAPSSAPPATTKTLAEQEAAAIKIQSIERGRQARKQVDEKKASGKKGWFRSMFGSKEKPPLEPEGEAVSEAVAPTAAPSASRKPAHRSVVRGTSPDKSGGVHMPVESAIDWRFPPSSPFIATQSPHSSVATDITLQAQMDEMTHSVLDLLHTTGGVKGGGDAADLYGEADLSLDGAQGWTYNKDLARPVPLDMSRPAVWEFPASPPPQAYSTPTKPWWMNGSGSPRPDYDVEPACDMRLSSQIGSMQASVEVLMWHSYNRHR